APPDPRALKPIALLLQARWDLDVSGPRDPHQLVAHEYRIAHVLERLRADREVELASGERPRLTRTDVALHPGVGAEALGRRIRRRPVQAALFVAEQIDHPIGPCEWACGTPDVEDQRVVYEQLEEPRAAGVKHRGTVLQVAAPTIEKVQLWYHTLELPGGVTPGWFDLRRQAERL